jgi:indole-3-glycerol phosphate synthase
MRRGLAAGIRARQAAGVMPVLSEIKVRSPKDGELLRGRDPEALATAMAGAGIAGLSIVTAREDFDGDLGARPPDPAPRRRADPAQGLHP